jgi:hypothetical protein
MSELLRALGALAEPPGPAAARPAAALGLPAPPGAAEHADVFLFQLYPYASVYLGAEGMLGGEARDRVAGFWRALGLQPPAEPDHLTPLLGLYSALADDPSEKARHAGKALLWEHLLSWLPFYLDAVVHCSSPFYRAWAALLGEALAAEAERVGPPASTPLALRAPAPLPDPRAAGSRAFLAALLAPARTGMVLVRDDLARAAAELGLGLRIAERRYVLEGLLSQDPERTLAWLAAKARAWGACHESRPEALRPVSRIWALRAKSAADTLANLAVAARELLDAGVALETGA